MFVNFLSFSLLSRAHVYRIDGCRQSPLLMLFPVELEVGDDPGAWESAGFTVDAGIFAGFLRRMQAMTPLAVCLQVLCILAR